MDHLPDFELATGLEGGPAAFRLRYILVIIKIIVRFRVNQV